VPTTDLIELFVVSLLSDLSFQPDPLTLAALSFTGISVGTSPLFFSPLSDDSLSDAFGNGLTADILGASVTVTAPIPEPSTLLLLGSGLLGFTGLRRRIGSSIRKRFNHR
jgi:PEP-CTERM motif